MKIVVIGGTGLIGSKTVAILRYSTRFSRSRVFTGQDPLQTSMHSATGCPVADGLAYPLTDHGKSDMLQSGPGSQTTRCTLIN